MRGRKADTPLEIPAKGWKDIMWRLKDEISEDRVSLIAAGIAFYALMALFPAITALIALGSLLVEAPQIISSLNTLQGMVPAEVLTIITDQAKEVAGSQKGGLGLTVVLGVLLALYSASNGVGSLIEGLNVAYDEHEERGFFVLSLIKLALAIFAICVTLLALVLLGAVPVLTAQEGTPLLMDIAIIIGVTLAAVTLIITALAVFYRYGPSRDNAQWGWLSVGAICGTLVWIVGSAGFAFYVANFADYNETFGTMGAVIILLMWIWLSAFIILLGAELNAEIEGQTRKDTTVGAPLPMGARDAQKADELGDAST